MRQYISLCLFMLASIASNCQDHMTPELLWELNRVSAQGISEDGSSVYYTITKHDIQEETKTTTHFKVSINGGVSDTIEEVHENKEQIEISKFYERLPNPAVIALTEFTDDGLEYKWLGQEEEDSDDVVED